MVTDRNSLDVVTRGDVARYEYRIFARSLTRAARLLGERATGHHDQPRENEIYVVSRARVDVGVKIRDGALEMKTLRSRAGDLQQWEMTCAAPLPVSGRQFKDVMAALNVMPQLDDLLKLGLTEILGVVGVEPSLAAVAVVKERRLFDIDPGRAEHTVVAGEGWAEETVAVECADADWVAQAAQSFGLTGWANIGYPARLSQRAFSSERGDDARHTETKEST